MSSSPASLTDTDLDVAMTVARPMAPTVLRGNPKRQMAERHQEQASADPQQGADTSCHGAERDDDKCDE